MCVCCVPGCGKEVRARGLCVRHYEQVRLHGRVLPIVRNRRLPNNVFIDGELAYVELYDNVGNVINYTTVCASDIFIVKKCKWHVAKNGYVANSEMRLLHRYILNLSDPHCKVDHVNRDRLDNRRNNLRLASFEDNAHNVGLTQRNTSGYKGVHFHPATNKWQTSINVNGRQIHLGTFLNPKTAAEVYDKAVIEHHGIEFGVTNVSLGLLAPPLECEVANG